MIYLDNAATTRPNRRAVERATEYLCDRFFNPSAYYKEGVALKREIEGAREYLLSTIASKDEWKLVFTSCGTESDNQALFSFARRGNFVTTAGEHSAIYQTANELKQRGIDVRFAPLAPDGSVKREELLKLVDEKTSLVSVIHVNNETGAINDVNALSKAVKAINPRAYFHSDGVQAFGKIPYRLGAGVDLYSFSAHKIGGLKGIGGLFVRKKAYNALRPFVFGGGQEDGRRSGTENVFGICQLRYAAEEKFAALQEDYERIKGYSEDLFSLLSPSLFVRLSPQSGTPYILLLSVPGVKGEVFLLILDDKGVLVGKGSACSSNSKNRFSRVLLSCGVKETVADGVIRISFSPETTKDEIMQAAKILNESAVELKERMKA